MNTYTVVRDQDFLREKSEPVESPEEARKILKKLERILKQYKNGLGLAAIQIGTKKRVGLIKYGNKRIELINPTIVSVDDEFIHEGEGCLSIIKTHVDIKRHRQITINNLVLDENNIDGWRTEVQSYFMDDETCKMDGLGTIAIQHEIDHFDGILIMDKKEEKTKPVQREKKVGRNKPCPCGSGKKYKKCCGG